MQLRSQQTPSSLRGSFSLLLHFAELEDVKSGQRVFDVKLQDETVLRDFDVIEAASGRNRSAIKRFDHIVASKGIVLELVPKAKHITPATAPILSAIEVYSTAEPIAESKPQSSEEH